MRRPLVASVSVLSILLSLILMPAQQMAVAAPVKTAAIIWQATLVSTLTYDPPLTVGGTAWAAAAPDAAADNDVADIYDAPAPPAPNPPNILIVFPNANYNFQRDVRQPTEVMEWNIQVTPNWVGFGTKAVTLTWDVSPVPAERSVQLFTATKDANTGAIVKGAAVVTDMRTTPQYQYTTTKVASYFVFTASVNQPPTVAVIHPNGGETLYGTGNVSANASDPDGIISQVSFEIKANGSSTWNLIATDTNGADGWSASWNTSEIADDYYLARATATDNMGATTLDMSDAAFRVRPGLLWRTRVLAAISTLAAESWAGVATDASAQLDNYDIVAPPDAPAPYLSFYSTHEDWTQDPNLHTDVRPPASSISWIFAVKTSVAGSVTLAWNASEIPQSYLVVQLLDAPTQAVVVSDMRSTSQYQYNAFAHIEKQFIFKVSTSLPPSVAVTAPASGSIVVGTLSVNATAIAVAPATISQVAIEYSHDNGNTWNSLGTDATAPYSVSWNTTALPNGDQYRVRATATDSNGETGRASSGAFMLDNIAPALPTLLTPAGGSFTSNTRPVFDWTDVVDIGGVTYAIQISKRADFGPDPANLFVSGLTDSTFTPSAAQALANANWFWRVQAANGGGISSAFSAAFTVLVSVGVPPPPTLLTPANGTIVATDLPAFTWTAVDDPAGIQYDVQVTTAGDAAFANPVINVTGQAPNASSPGFTPVANLADESYLWRVRAVRIGGNQAASSFTAASIFIVDTTPPGTPALQTPANGATVGSGTPAFTWTAVTDLSGVLYTLEVAFAADQTFASPVIHQAGIAANIFTPTTALVDNAYVWRVTAVEAAGASRTSGPTAAANVRVDTALPVAPTLTSPSNGSVIGTGTPTFNWTAVADASGVVYTIDVTTSTDTAFASPVIHITGLATAGFTPSATLADGSYIWRVTPSEATGLQRQGIASDTFGFRLDTVIPAAPVLTAPSNDAVIGTGAPTFNWSTVTDASGVVYTIDVTTSTDTAFASPVIHITGLTTAGFAPSAALADGSYIWRAIPHEATGLMRSGIPSSSANVRVDTVLPSAPTLTAPSNNAVIDTGTPTFNWTAVTDASGVVYTLEIAESTDTSFASPVLHQAGLAVTSTAPTTPLEDAAYIWRVIPYEATGLMRAGIPSSTVTFRLDTVLPSVPTLTAPSNDAVIDTGTPTFTWTAVTDASGVVYTIDVAAGTDTAFASPVIHMTGLTTAGFTPSAVLADGSYIWRVTPSEATGLQRQGIASDTFGFRLDTVLPAAPVLTGPSNDAVIGTGTPTFTWTAVTDASGVVYTIDVATSTDTAFASPVIHVAGLTAAGFAPSAALADGSYIWRVIPYEATGLMRAGTPSATAIFRVDTLLPTAPTLTGPANAAVMATSTPAFFWTAVNDPSGVAYTLQVTASTDISFATPAIHEQGLTVTTFTPATPLSGNTYIWRVSASEATGLMRAGAWSAPFYFTVTSRPTVTVTYPNGGETLWGVVTVSANATDLDGTITSVAFEYSSNNGTTWNPIAAGIDGADGWSVSWNTAQRTDGSYLIRATAADNDSLTSSDTSDAAFNIDNILWKAQLRASGNSLSDNDNEAGVARAASIDLDVFDAPKPPPPEDYVRLVFPHGDWPVSPDNYSRDMRPAADDLVWDFEVTTTFNGSVTLTWDVSAIPSSYKMVVLRDTKNTPATTDDASIDMRTAGQYTFTATAGTAREFKFIVSVKTFTYITLQTGWNLLSLPLDASPQDWGFQLGDDFTSLYLFWYDPTSGGYRMWTAEAPIFVPEPGKGYWVKAPSPTTIDIEGYPVPDSDFTIHVKPGWNMIGNPFGYAVDWVDAKVSYNGSVATIMESHSNFWVLHYAYGYDPVTGGYQMFTAPDGVLSPWRGYWVKSLVEADLIIPNKPSQVASNSSPDGSLR